MPITTGRLRARMWAIVIALVATILIAYSYLAAVSAAAKHRAELASFSSRIALGMPRNEVDRLCSRACFENSGWKNYPHFDPFGLSATVVETAVTIGAKNWAVFIVFENDMVAAVLVRTEDSPRTKPDEAPQDRVQNVREPWLAEFRPRKRK
jgi:hypothetical protein